MNMKAVNLLVILLISVPILARANEEEGVYDQERWRASPRTQASEEFCRQVATLQGQHVAIVSADGGQPLITEGLLISTLPGTLIVQVERASPTLELGRMWGAVRSYVNCDHILSVRITNQQQDKTPSKE